MGVSGKWFKALVGSKKSEKSQSSEHDENAVSIILYPSHQWSTLVSVALFFD